MTIDSIGDLPATVDSLGRFARRPTARIVFDEWVSAEYYADAAHAIHGVSDVMGELLDSYYVREYSLAQYEARAREYVGALADDVDVWEIGNEINGEWLGPTADVVAKMRAAFDVVEAAGEPTALTLYYNDGCWARADHEMFTWAEANVPAAMRDGLDWVLVSYYEDDCEGLQPDWPAVFHRLAALFPEARIGFGECGTADAARAADMLAHYYDQRIAEPAWVGGWFWWYYLRDMVPAGTPLWTELDMRMRATPD